MIYQNSHDNAASTETYHKLLCSVSCTTIGFILDVVKVSAQEYDDENHSIRKRLVRENASKSIEWCVCVC